MKSNGRICALWQMYHPKIFYCDTHMVTYLDSRWIIFDTNRRVVACATSVGEHPLTVYAGEWLFANKDGWMSCPEFRFKLTSNGTEEEPHNLHHIGLDFFVRNQVTCIIWYIDPITNKVEHSGRKKNGRYGRRYCCICQKSISANNFVTHLHDVHFAQKECKTIDDVKYALTVVARQLQQQGQQETRQ